MFVFSYRVSVQEKQFHLNSLFRSTDSTAREIELYIGSLQRVLRIFAMEEHDLLVDAILNPLVYSQIEEKIGLHFPEHLAFALSDPHARAPIVSEPELFGAHCQSNLSSYNSGDFVPNTELSLHSAGPDGTKHFDLMTRIGTSNLNGILFISFEIDVLQRLMKFGSTETFSLALYENSVSSKLKDNSVLLESETRMIKDAQEMPSNANYAVPINGTPWMLYGTLDSAKTDQSRNFAVLQSVIGAIVLIFAGLTAWRSIEQEKVSRNRTTIVLDNVEAERKRIARELHDQVLSDASHAKRLLMDLGPESETDTSQNAEKLRSAQKCVEEFSTSIRSAIDDLYPHTLENLGLINALEAYAQKRCQSDQSLDFLSPNDIDSFLHADQKLHIYRIVSELISNALAHSGCTTLMLSVEKHMNSIVVRFEDNGTGFDYESASKQDRHGLTNIESRTATLEATGKWKRSNGMCFELTVPVKIHDRS